MNQNHSGSKSEKSLIFHFQFLFQKLQSGHTEIEDFEGPKGPKNTVV